MAWTSVLGRYAQRLHQTAGTKHHVVSALGAWLVLALVAKAAPPDHDLADALGTTPDEAAAIAAALLEQPHSLVAAATAVWFGPGADLRRLAGWQAALPAATSCGPLPEPPELDRWIHEHSHGLIEAMADVSPEALLTLASVLATKISWREPFLTAPAADLGRDTPWASRLDRVLRTPSKGHRMFIARTDHAGEVIVHVARGARAEDDLDLDFDGPAGGDEILVVSVAAAPGVDSCRVLAAAYEIAPACVSGRRLPDQVSLHRLPLGETALWTIRESEQHGATEGYRAVLPCWTADSTHALSADATGFPAAARVLAGLLGVADPIHQSRQSAVARYGRYGFEAAALTTTITYRSARIGRPFAREAELRFAHPYAVVAVTSQTSVSGGDAGHGPWHAVPVFSAWIDEPAELFDR